MLQSLSEVEPVAIAIDDLALAPDDGVSLSGVDLDSGRYVRVAITRVDPADRNPGRPWSASIVLMLSLALLEARS